MMTALHHSQHSQMAVVLQTPACRPVNKRWFRLGFLTDFFPDASVAPQPAQPNGFGAANTRLPTGEQALHTLGA